MAITYKAAGVDIDAGDELVERIKPLARRTYLDTVVEGVGGFAALSALPPDIQEPLLVSGTDGVGTKLKVAFATGHYRNGILLAPVTAEIIRSIVLGKKPPVDIEPFQASRLVRDAPPG